MAAWITQLLSSSTNWYPNAFLYIIFGPQPSLVFSLILSHAITEKYLKQMPLNNWRKSFWVITFGEYPCSKLTVTTEGADIWGREKSLCVHHDSHEQQAGVALIAKVCINSTFFGVAIRSLTTSVHHCTQSDRTSIYGSVVANYHLLHGSTEHTFRFIWLYFFL